MNNEIEKTKEIDEEFENRKKTRGIKSIIRYEGYMFGLKFEGKKSFLYWCTKMRINTSDCTAKLNILRQQAIKYYLGIIVNFVSIDV